MRMAQTNPEVRNLCVQVIKTPIVPGLALHVQQSTAFTRILARVSISQSWLELASPDTANWSTSVGVTRIQSQQTAWPSGHSPRMLHLIHSCSTATLFLMDTSLAHLFALLEGVKVELAGAHVSIVGCHAVCEGLGLVFAGTHCRSGGLLRRGLRRRPRVTAGEHGVHCTVGESTASTQSSPLHDSSCQSGQQATASAGHLRRCRSWGRGGRRRGRFLLLRSPSGAV